ncbi:MAG: alpha/beta hydrolase [Lachnospiraceae bacterium]
MRGLMAVLGIGATVVAAEVGIAAYFFKRTLIRQNATTKRTIEMAGTDWNQYFPMMEECKTWMLEQPHEEVWIRSHDGWKLHGTFFPQPGSNKLIIAFHGYTSKGMSDYIGLSNYYLRRGYQMLLVDARAHGESEGTYIGFGCLDRQDAKSWIEYAQKRLGENCKMWLHGDSMGGATVLMAAGLDLPESVKGIIADCPFTSAWDVFAHVLKSQYHLPAFPILHLADKMVQSKAGYSLKQCSAIEEVKKAKVPILIIHGKADTFVPYTMGKKIHDACGGKKELLIVEGAGHCEAYYKDRKAYEEKLTSFFDEQEEKQNEEEN